MNSCPETAPSGRPELTLVASLKFAVVICLILAVALPFPPSLFHFIFAGGATGMFVAEYFCRTRLQNFIALLLVPALFGAVGTVIPFLHDPNGVESTSIIVWALIGFFVAIVPAAVSVVAISLLCRFAFYLTGIRFLKFHWGVTKPLESDQSPLAS